MGKKKRGHPDIEEVLARPWCYYCERDFDDLKILIDHQRAKHFKCDKCGRRLNTAGGLNVHMSQVHKEQLTAVDNALPNRAGLDIEIFGTEGIPEEVAAQHRQRVLQNFHQAEAERRATTGNPPPGGSGGSQPKKPKFETPSQMKARLAAHKQKLAEQTSGGGSGGATPVGAGQSQSPAMGQSSNGYSTSPSQFPSYQQPYSNAPGSGPFPQSQPFNQAPPQGQPFQQPPSSFPPNPSFSPPPFQNHPAPPPQFQNQAHPPPSVQNSAPGFPPGPPGAPGGPPRGFGATSPASFQNQSQFNRTQTPPQNVSPAPRPPSLPTAPGLPQRPAFGAPHVNAFQMQQMHQGQIPGPPNPSNPPNPSTPNYPGQETKANGFGQPQPSNVPPPGMSTETSANATSLDDLISGASKEAEGTAPVRTDQTPDKQPKEAGEEKPARKEKEKSKPSRLVYSDNEVSPEEKMASFSRYAYTPEDKSSAVLGRVEGTVTGPVHGPDDVADPAG